MTIEAGLLLTAGAMVAAAAAAWGGFRSRLATMEKDQAATAEAIRELRASSVRQGERMGDLEKLLEKEIGRLEQKIAIDRAVRRATGAIPATRADEPE